jgi:hypothetical protein
VLDAIIAQDGSPPFNPRTAVRKFARVLKDYGLDSVSGDRYAGETHRYSFTEEGIRYVPSSLSATDIYEATEPLMNAGELEFLDHPKLQEQLLTLVVRGAKITHQAGDHDDYANAACACLALMPKNVREADWSRHRPVRVLRQYGEAKNLPNTIGGSDWDGWFASTPRDDRAWKPAPRVHTANGSYELNIAPRRRPASAAELHTIKTPKTFVGSFWFQPHGDVAGDGRQRYSIHAPSGAQLALAWGEDEAREVAERLEGKAA